MRDAAVAGFAAPQPRREIAELTHGPTPPTDEDCLTLNVWAPPPADRPRPVLVWIHGGGWILGAASMEPYRGALLAAADLVVVTVNYRLGSLGWLYHARLFDVAGAPAGNWGLLDMLAALRWVQQNIAAFGGDPARVTVAGQSSGASSVAALLVAPGADGLFTRAIVQSPALLESAHDPEHGTRWAEALSEWATGRPGFDVEALRELSSDAVVAGHDAILARPLYRGTRGGALPTVDPPTIPLSPTEAPAARPAVDVLVGTTLDESAFHFRLGGRRLEPDSARLRELVALLRLPDDPDALIARHRAEAERLGEPIDSNALLVRIHTREEFVGPTLRWARERAAGGACVYLYRVEHAAPEAGVGAPHMIDVPLLFGTFRCSAPAAALAGDGPETEAVSGAMQRAWGAFAHGRDPGWSPLGPADAAPLAVFGGPGGPCRIET